MLCSVSIDQHLGLLDGVIWAAGAGQVDMYLTTHANIGRTLYNRWSIPLNNS